MHVVTDREQEQHEWVGAALVGLGRGTAPRAEHALRTGNHVLGERTRIEVLEVYCGRCRLGYTSGAARVPCPAAVRARAS